MSAFIPLKRCARVEYGLGQPPPLSSNGVPIIRATNISQGHIRYGGLIRANLEDLDLDRTPLLKLGEILVVRSGAYTGDSALITQKWVGSAPGYDLRITPNLDSVPQFIAYSILGQQAIDQIDLAKSRAAQPHINAEDLGNVRILDAPVRQQLKIVNLLDRETTRIDKLVAAKQRLVNLLEERRTTILINTVAPHLTASRKVPDNWMTTRLRYLFYPPVAGAWGNEPEKGAFNTLCVRVADFDRKRFRINERAGTIRNVEPSIQRKCRLKPGDVLIEKSGGGEGQPVGFPVTFDLSAKAICSNFIARLRPRQEVEPAFVGLVLAAAYRAGCNVPYVKQTTGIQNLDLSAYLTLPWHIPPRRTQASICTFLRSAFATIDEMSDMLRSQISLLHEHRRALITLAVTDELTCSLMT